jgi:hypothetical protein
MVLYFNYHKEMKFFLIQKIQLTNNKNKNKKIIKNYKKLK